MASTTLPRRLLVLALSLLVVLPLVHGASRPAKLVYHGGPLLSGNVRLSVLWYGQFGRVQKNTIRSFLKSINYNAGPRFGPQVSNWWRMVESYQSMAGRNARPGRIQVQVVKQMVDTSFFAGKIMTIDFIKMLVDKVTAGSPNTLAVIFTARDVTVQGLCMGECSQHGLIGQQPYVLVGNPESECPGACAWPFYKSNFRAGPVLRPPSGNIGADAMVSSLASGLAAAMTNPLNTGFYSPGQRSKVEATTACQDIYGSGARPGYAGKVWIDRRWGGAFNAIGVKGKKFLLPAIWNPRTQSCWTPL